ncbi:hypothetical protein CLOM_g12026 [Closterium sp. NIES-68]|nr:hypothetical protein CLOM_g12026 [Closterium sp. NIES-68]
MIPRGVPSLSHGVRSGRKRAVRFDPASGGLDIRGGEECGGDTNEGAQWKGGGSEGAKGGGVSELHGQRGGGSERRETAAVKRGLNGPGRLSKDAARKSSITFQAVAEQDGDEQDESEAYKMARVEAVRLLSLKQLSEAQLRQKLKSNLTQPERARGLARRAGTRQPRGSMPVEQADAAIDAAVTSMKQLGFVNDTEYAEAFARGRFNRLAWGPARLRMELKKRGLSSRDTNAAMENIYKSSSATEDGFSNSDDIGDFEEHDPSNHVGFSKEAWLTLTAQASRVWSRGSDVPIEKRKQRLVGWLQRRGYNWEQTWKVVNFLQRET